MYACGMFPLSRMLLGWACAWTAAQDLASKPPQSPDQLHGAFGLDELISNTHEYCPVGLDELNPALPSLQSPDQRHDADAQPLQAGGKAQGRSRGRHH